MEENVGKIDRCIRLLATIVLIAVGYFLHIWVLYVIALIPLLTGSMKFCPLYVWLKINTKE